MASAPPRPFRDSRLAEAEQAIADGRYAQARVLLAALEPTADASLLTRIGGYYTHLGRHAEADHCYQRVAHMRPDSAAACYDLATSRLALGLMSEAESLFDRAIALDPRDWDAWANRSTLRRATPGNNHVEQLRRQLGLNRDPSEARIALGYALGKELEDLGEHEAAFQAFAEAARNRRSRLSYSVAEDIATMEQIAAAFGDAAAAAAPPDNSASGPVFVLGLPRSGSTLVDRILSSHPEVDSAGEVQDFALSLLAHAGRFTSKSELIQRSATLDATQVGETYRRRMRARGFTARHCIDKTPLNFLYIGLIARALPEARIIHVRRGAMDNGYAMFKTLFRMGYPFSYDLSDLGQYLVATHRLMEHWHRTLPGRIITVDYERLVSDQQTESRRLLAALGLDWHPACLDFHANESPVATASAAQVREPVHRRSLALWRRHEASLAPMSRILLEAGVPLE